MKINSSTLQTAHLADLIILLLLFILLGLSASVGWRAWEGGGRSGSVVMTTQSATIPELKLNSTHQRQGASINVRPEDIGRSNPFAQP